jgi:hypothetical protein
LETYHQLRQQHSRPWSRPLLRRPQAHHDRPARRHAWQPCAARHLAAARRHRSHRTTPSTTTALIPIRHRQQRRAQPRQRTR